MVVLPLEFIAAVAAVSAAADIYHCRHYCYWRRPSPVVLLIFILHVKVNRKANRQAALNQRRGLPTNGGTRGQATGQIKVTITNQKALAQQQALYVYLLDFPALPSHVSFPGDHPLSLCLPYAPCLVPGAFDRRTSYVAPLSTA